MFDSTITRIEVLEKKSQAITRERLEADRMTLLLQLAAKYYHVKCEQDALRRQIKEIASV